MNDHARSIAKKHFKREWENLQETERHVIGHYLEGTPATHLPRHLSGEKLTPGQRLADQISSFGGSWPFIILFFLVLLSWIGLNSFILARLGKAFDPYPYILLNLVLSMLASLQAPIIMMSQNRQSQKDREQALADYEINLKAELEIHLMHEKVDELVQKRWEELLAIQEKQTALLNRLESRKT
jgi:uncharacterized membrane protein